MAKYDALLSGLRLAGKMGIKEMKVQGDFEMVINHVNILCEAWKFCLKNYKNIVWDEIGYYNAFNITVVPRIFNKLADSMASTATLFQPYLKNPYTKYTVQVSFHPSVPDNIGSWQVFEDDKQICNFLNCINEFPDHIVDEL
jgi:hypothetical protein